MACLAVKLAVTGHRSGHMFKCGRLEVHHINQNRANPVAWLFIFGMLIAGKDGEWYENWTEYNSGGVIIHHSGRQK